MISLHEGKGSRARKSKPTDRVFQLHCQLADCQPLIWRRVLVRESMWLSRLHDSIQVMFDWFDYQTHVFSFGDLRFGNPVKREGLVVEDDRDVTLADLDLDHHAHFDYSYHFDEGWKVQIKVEKVLPLPKGVRHPRCMAGERAGPPEDCGGVEAYHDMLASLKEPETDLGREWKEWLGPDFSAEACDLAKIEKALRKLGR